MYGFLRSNTGVLASTDHESPVTEHEPLLGRPGDVAQDERKGLAYNLITGISAMLNILEGDTNPFF